VRTFRHLLWPAAALLIVTVATGLALGKAADTAVFRQAYGAYIKEGTDLAKAMPCLVCHDKMPATKTGLNPYGQDQAKAAAGKPITAAILRSIEKLDSDKDGVNNLDELKAGTLPGDPKSKPKK
jgi:hypothetical protein